MAFVSHWRRSLSLALTAGVSPPAACATSPPRKWPHTAPPTPDPRVGLKAGLHGRRRGRVEPARWSPRRRRPRSSSGSTNSDLAFIGNYAIQGNYNGFQIWDISEPGQADARRRRTSARPRRATCRSTRTCSSCRARALTGRLDCGGAGRQGHREPRAAARHPDLRHHRHQEPEEHRQRADLPRLAHPHGARGSEGHGERLRLHLRLGGRPLAQRAAGLRRA